MGGPCCLLSRCSLLGLAFGLGFQLLQLSVRRFGLRPSDDQLRLELGAFAGGALSCLALRHFALFAPAQNARYRRAVVLAGHFA